MCRGLQSDIDWLWLLGSYIFMAYIAMACVGTAYVVMAYVVIACVVMAYIVMACRACRPALAARIRRRPTVD